MISVCLSGFSMSHCVSFAFLVTMADAFCKMSSNLTGLKKSKYLGNQIQFNTREISLNEFQINELGNSQY